MSTVYDLKVAAIAYTIQLAIETSDDADQLRTLKRRLMNSLAAGEEFSMHVHDLSCAASDLVTTAENLTKNRLDNR